ncbi:hypothetical protein Anapl_14269 [Anas platyrhynchos]|uniref:Uncharacterized protein n=1 Tax=Anas platyrhynchos TaxID=8839 RepID=R0LDE9_ANAPL|nr:hypothetical protein Anapl_14269 [Anas platyrhynchos]
MRGSCFPDSVLLVRPLLAPYSCCGANRYCLHGPGNMAGGHSYYSISTRVVRHHYLPFPKLTNPPQARGKPASTAQRDRGESAFRQRIKVLSCWPERCRRQKQPELLLSCGITIFFIILHGCALLLLTLGIIMRYFCLVLRTRQITESKEVSSIVADSTPQMVCRHLAAGSLVETLSLPLSPSTVQSVKLPLQISNLAGTAPPAAGTSRDKLTLLLKFQLKETGAAIHMHIVKLQAQSLCILLHENQRQVEQEQFYAFSAFSSICMVDNPDELEQTMIVMVSQHRSRSEGLRITPLILCGVNMPSSKRIRCSSSRFTRFLTGITTLLD